jgi:hypothetical protein
MTKTPHIGKHSSRTDASFMWNVNLDQKQQLVICKTFNDYLNRKRSEYHSLFLSNYREGQRKRISFEFAVKLINSSVMLYCTRHSIPKNKAITNVDLQVDQDDTDDE